MMKTGRRRSVRRKMIIVYLLKKKPRSTETMQVLRNFTDIFYDIYENAFINSLHAEKISSIMMLFLTLDFLTQVLSEKKIK